MKTTRTPDMIELTKWSAEKCATVKAYVRADCIRAIIGISADEKYSARTRIDYAIKPESTQLGYEHLSCVMAQEKAEYVAAARDAAMARAHS